MDTYPRLVRPVPDHLGLYFRVGHRDHTTFLELLSEGSPRMSGVIFDPCSEYPLRDLPAVAASRSFETILDSRGMEMAFDGPNLSRLARLPWGSSEPDRPQAFGGNGTRGLRMIGALADYLARGEFSAILAPTHFLDNGPDDPWFEVDRSLARNLRDRLNNNNLSRILLYYPLALPARVFRNKAAVARIASLLETLPIDGVWLRIHPFGTRHSGPLSLRSYIESTWSLRRLNVPLVGERTGTVGIALLAFNAVSGIESGVTLGENFDIGRWSRPNWGAKPFLPTARVYLKDLGIFLTADQAGKFFENRHIKATFACRDTDCCRRGAVDMIENPRRHFVLSRVREVSRLTHIPPFTRASQYLEDHLRPASDLIIKAAKVDPALDRQRRRIDGWRQTLGAMVKEGLPQGVPMVPSGRRLQHKLGA